MCFQDVYSAGTAHQPSETDWTSKLPPTSDQNHFGFLSEPRRCARVREHDLTGKQ